MPDTFATLDLPPSLAGDLWKLSPQERGRARAMHRHREPEFNVVTAGHAAYLLCDRRDDGVRRISLRRGSLLFLYPDQDHILAEPSRDFTLWIAVFTPELAQSAARMLPDGDTLAGAFAPAKVGAHFKEPELRRLETLFGEVRDEAACAKTSSGGAAVFNAALAYVLAWAWTFSLRAADAQTTPVHPSVAGAARLLAGDTGDVPLSEIARRVRLSPSRLSRLFHEQTGETIAAFRNRQRIARFHAGDPRTTLLECALAAGFGSYAQFHRVYRAMVGGTPRNSG